MSVLDLIKNITSNRESGRLDINAAGTPGTLLFHEGKLVDARLGSLSGFQAVNAAVALRDVEVSFDHVAPASHVSHITPSERLILSRFFGIEAADMEEPKAAAREPEIDWNPEPEPVVPLAPARTNPLAFFSRPLFVVVCVALLLGVVVGAVALRSKVKSLQQSAAVASAVEQAPSSVPESQPSVAESSSVAESQPSVAESQPEVKPVAAEPAPIPASPKKETLASTDTPAPAVAVAPREPADRDVNVQDLNGEWRVINTVEKTAYKSFGNMQIGFRLTINQNGNEFTATGEKFSENGQTLPIARRTPIQVKGSINGDKVTATFIEDGRSRRTNGRFVWKLQTGRDGLAGTFVSNAANTSGRSAVTRL